MISHWIKAARLKTLTVSVCPVAIGVALTINHPTFNWLIAGITLGTALLIQLGTNFTNDYVDFKKGADTDDRLGPKRMTQAGLINVSQMKRAATIAFGLAVIGGFALILYGGWPILAIGCTAIFFGVIYTAGPYALAYIGGAELISFLYFGPIAVCGTIFLQTSNITKPHILIGCAIGLITSALLVVNNTRDIESDKRVNKKTFAVRFGRLFSYIEYIIFMYAPLFLLDMVTVDSAHQLIMLLTLVFVAMILTRRFGKAKGEAFNKLLTQTSGYLVLFTLATIYLMAA